MRATLMIVLTAFAALAGCGDDAVSLRFATFNAGLAPGDVPYSDERAPVVSELLANADVDVLCVQEYWVADDFVGLAEGAADTLPNTVRHAPLPGATGCATEVVEALQTCVEDRCPGLCGGELIACALNRNDGTPPGCYDELVTAGAACQGCALEVAMGGGCIDDVARECDLGEEGPEGFLYGGVFDTGILTNLPITAEDSLVLDSQVVRSAVDYALVDSPLGPVHVFCTHFASNIGLNPYTPAYSECGATSYEDEQDCQIDQVLAFIEEKAGVDGPVVLLGDLNTGPVIERAAITAQWPDHYDRFLAAGFENPYAAQPDVACTVCRSSTFHTATTTEKLIDHILLRGVPGSASVERFMTDTIVLPGPPPVTTHPSDHYGLVLTLTR